MKIFRDESYSNKTPVSNIDTRNKGERCEYNIGVVFTKDGIVRVMSQPGQFAFTRLDFVKNGRMYIRSYEKQYSNRYCATLASQFAKDVLAGKCV